MTITGKERSAIFGSIGSKYICKALLYLLCTNAVNLVSRKIGADTGAGIGADTGAGIDAGCVKPS